jgi:hypothetical protein
MEIKFSESQLKTVRILITQELDRVRYLHYNAGCECGKRVKELQKILEVLPDVCWETLAEEEFAKQYAEDQVARGLKGK